MMLTIDSVLALHPCGAYTRDKIEAYARGRKRVRLTTVLRDERIPLPDRIWLGCALLPEIRWWCADRAVRVHAVAALREAWLDAQADTLAALPEIVDAATANAARAAARAAAAEAADAAYSADYAAAYAAANAARAAAYAACAACAAAYAAYAAEAAAEAAEAAADAAEAAEAAERRAQLDRLIAMAGGAT
jgi:hypothetical protein